MLILAGFLLIVGIVCLLALVPEGSPAAGGTLPKPPQQRWAEHNRKARERGCLCGRPGTHVRYGFAIGGSAETWSCAEHVNVNAWARAAGQRHWIPAGDYSAEALQWTSEPVEASPR